MRLLLSLVCLFVSSAVQAAEPDKPAKHVDHRIEGWRVRVDDRLLAEQHKDLGLQALALLQARLVDIVTVVPPPRVAKLREVPIVLDLNHGALTSMQYHPSVEWLTNNGYASALAKCVHLPSAERFVHPRHQQVQPWCLLHELAHAYHDQVLGFGEPRVVAAFQQYCDSGGGRPVLHIGGKRVRHYALTNAKEFFAEMTECYFGTNDFYPFVQAELRDAQPQVYSLLREIWGPTPLHPES